MLRERERERERRQHTGLLPELLGGGTWQAVTLDDAG